MPTFLLSNAFWERVEGSIGMAYAASVHAEAALRLCSWCAPEEWDAFIADRQKRKDLGQPPRNWRQLKRRKHEIKAKQSALSMEWLHK